MKEEQFYQSVKESFDGFAPEVPSHIYEAVQDKLQKRRALVWLGFSLNTWIVALGMAGVGLLAWGLIDGNSVPVAEKATYPVLSEASGHVLYKAHQSIEVEESADMTGAAEEHSFAATQACISGSGYSNHRSSQVAAHSATNPAQPELLTNNAGNTGNNADNTGSTASLETESAQNTGVDESSDSTEQTFTLPLKVKKVVYVEKEEKKD